jgi:F-type H+-transporting ATPase subunit a
VAAEAGHAINPIEQFSISPIIPIHIGRFDFSFTNSALYMLIAVGVVAALMIIASNGSSGAPGRLQALGEMAYEFMAGMLRSAAGEHAEAFFPLVFCIFMFILLCNLIGLIPYTFSVTSHIIVTASLALLVFFTVIIVGFAKNGLGFLKLFVPSGVPIYILPVVVAIEVFSFFVKPLSHSVRLFANMLAGHITLNVFGGFVVMLLGAGAAVKAIAVLPMAMTIGLEALELLVAFLQAYVFAMLTCMYLNDALHPGGH